MKTINYLLLSAVLFVAAACSRSGNELLQVIPEHPAYVVKVDMASIIADNGLTDDDGKFILSPELVKILDEHQHSFATRVIKSLPASGIDFKSEAYLFSASSEFHSEFLATLSDSGAARKWVCSLSNENSMQSDKELDYVLNGNMFYAISGDILFVGAAKTSSNIAKLTAAVASMLNGDGNKLIDNKPVVDALDADGNITAYLAVAEVCRNTRSMGALQRMTIGGMSLSQLLSGMEIDALAMNMHLGKRLDVEAKVVAKPNSAYKMMFGSLISKPSADFLKLIPASMTTKLSVSLKGKNMLNIPAIKQIISSAKAFPIIRDFDLQKIISTIDGPVAVGVSLDPDFIDEYNVVVVMASVDADAVISELNKVAAKYGKHPQSDGNESIYEYFNQRITVGVADNRYVYFKLNTDDIDSTPVADASLVELFGKSPIGLDVTAEGYDIMLGFESSEKMSCHLSGLDSGDRPVLFTIVNELCKIDTTKHIDEDFGDDSDFGTAKPIDGFSTF